MNANTKHDAVPISRETLDELVAALKQLVKFDSAEREIQCQVYSKGSPQDRAWDQARAALAKVRA